MVRNCTREVTGPFSRSFFFRRKFLVFRPCFQANFDFLLFPPFFSFSFFLLGTWENCHEKREECFIALSWFRPQNWFVRLVPSLKGARRGKRNSSWKGEESETLHLWTRNIWQAYYCHCFSVNMYAYNAMYVHVDSQGTRVFVEGTVKLNFGLIQSSTSFYLQIIRKRTVLRKKL